jgi:hypothetical protein
LLSDLDPLLLELLEELLSDDFDSEAGFESEDADFLYESLR